MWGGSRLAWVIVGIEGGHETISVAVSREVGPFWLCVGNSDGTH